MVVTGPRNAALDTLLHPVFRNTKHALYLTPVDTATASTPVCHSGEDLRKVCLSVYFFPPFVLVLLCVWWLGIFTVCLLSSDVYFASCRTTDVFFFSLLLLCRVFEFIFVSLNVFLLPIREREFAMYFSLSSTHFACDLERKKK